MKRYLMDYLPYVIREYAEFQGICVGEQPEFDRLWEALDRFLDQQFLVTAGPEGLARWETLLGITPKGTDSADERRFRILTRLNEELPYTLPQLKKILERLCGAGNFSAQVDAYTLAVRIGLAAKSNFGDVESLLRRVTPENLVIDLQQMYIRNRALRRHTHAQLAQYTHHQIRNEVKLDGE